MTAIRYLNGNTERDITFNELERLMVEVPLTFYIPETKMGQPVLATYLNEQTLELNPWLKDAEAVPADEILSPEWNPQEFLPGILKDFPIKASGSIRTLEDATVALNPRTERAPVPKLTKKKERTRQPKAKMETGDYKISDKIDQAKREDKFINITSDVPRLLRLSSSTELRVLKKFPIAYNPKRVQPPVLTKRLLDGLNDKDLTALLNDEQDLTILFPESRSKKSFIEQARTRLGLPSVIEIREPVGKKLSSPPKKPVKV